MQLLTDKEWGIAKAIRYYRGIGMRWCKIERMYQISEAEGKRLICLYNQALKEASDGGIKK